jgi:glycosyltransferase involved in cell wall biosynthesis
VFAISAAAAEDFVRTLGVPRERIEVTPLGIDPAPRGGEGHAGGAPAWGASGGASVPGDRWADAHGIAAVDARLRARLELDGRRVVLCVAQKRPYKNLHRLVRALPELDGDVALVLPGAPTAYEVELRELAGELAVAERVRFPEWLSDAELDGLYRIADVFVLPSLIEGFGLPVLEAMARGVAVACSNTSALPEVAGDAALLFDPERQEEVTGAIRRLLEDRALAERLIARGRERAAHFTWRRTGAASLAGYRRAIAAHAGRRRR